MKSLTKIIKFILILVFISSLNTQCKKDDKEDPGPISVDNSISPTTVSSGSSIQWDIRVSNLGGEVQVERVHLREEFISGWAQGQGTVDMDLPISNITIGDHATKTLYSVTTPVINTGNTDVEVKNTVTVYSNGGTDTDVIIYKITMNKKKGSKGELVTLVNILSK
ncbi:MAG: hypothetical protein K8S00_12955 [Bacteroidales bacterium]|nr:hypothetical protein [Bacteroidales bacterium]